MKWLRNIVEDAVRLVVGQLIDVVLERLDRIEDKIEDLRKTVADA